MSTYKTFNLYLEEYCDRCGDFEAAVEKKRMLAHQEKKCILQIFVVKMRTDVEECMNKLFGNRRQEGKGD